MYLETIKKGIYYNDDKRLLFIDKQNIYNINDVVNIIQNCDLKTKRNIPKYNNYKTFRKIEILLTNKCNMSCIYCYSQNNRSYETISFEQIKLLIDQSIRNNLLEEKLFNRSKHIDLLFHGGGEPICEFELLKKIVVYCKNCCNDKGIKLNLHLKTNGLFDLKVLRWLIKNDFTINISLDGNKNFHDKQRTSKNNGSTFAIIKRNLDYLNKEKSKFEIRTTITKLNIDNMIEFSHFIENEWPNVKSVIFEPIMIYDDRYRFLQIENINDYIISMEEINKFFTEKGIKFNFNVSTDMLLTAGICGGLMFNICIVDANGNISICQERCNDKMFIYGKVKEGKIEWDEEKVKKIIMNCKLDKICDNCFIKNTCYGGCISRRKAYNREHYCAIQKYLYKKAIMKLIEDKEKLCLNIIENEDYIIMNW